MFCIAHAYILHVAIAQQTGVNGGSQRQSKLLPVLWANEMVLEIRQVKQQLTQVGLIIHRATQALRDDKTAPKELIDCVRRLDQQSQQAQQRVQDPEDEFVLMRCIADLEETSDRVKEACDKASDLSAQAKSAVQLAHKQVSSLKYQIH
jgi:hypothetical protein